jgi:putative Holliday junction resolvase
MPEPGSVEAPRTLLGFDYGERSIGVAVGQTLTGTATALGTVAVRRRQPDWATISRIVEEWRPDGLVVGEPLNMDGTTQTMTRRAQRFGRQLAERYRLPVFAADERLSTREARWRMAAEGDTARADHPLAAQIILETWLAESSGAARTVADGRRG